MAEEQNPAPPGGRAEEQNPAPPRGRAEEQNPWRDGAAGQADGPVAGSPPPRPPGAASGDGLHSVETVAYVCCIHPRRVQQLVAAGHIPRAMRGRYDLIRAVQGYIRYLQAEAQGQGEGDLTAERVRLAREQADRLARENAVARGDLIPRGEIVAAWSQFVHHCRAKLLALPSKLAPMLADRPVADCKERLTQGIHDALDDLSRSVVEPAAAEPRRADGGERADAGGGKLETAAPPVH